MGESRWRIFEAVIKEEKERVIRKGEGGDGRSQRRRVVVWERFRGGGEGREEERQ